MHKPQILHIAQDEKFINAAHYLFEKAFPGDNQFIIVKPPADPPVKYINDEVDAEYIVNSPEMVLCLLEKTREVEVVLLHGMNRMKGALFLRSTEKQKFVANIYGAEIYNDTIAGDDFMGKKTRRLNQKLQRKPFLAHLKELYRMIRYRDTRGLYDDVNMKEVLGQLEIVGLMSEITHQNHIKKGILNPKSRMIPFSYYPIDYLFNNHKKGTQGNHILLGNSASYTNNHIEAIDMLAKITMNGSKIITPLSYGYTDYADAVQQYGKQKLGEKFEPIRTFMSLDEYNQLIGSCRYVIMNHYRSQAMGNLIASLYMGAKVFVNRTNAYQYFKNIGCHIYLIANSFQEGTSSPLNPLTQEQVRQNREALENELSTRVLMNRLREAFRNLFGFG